VIFSVRNSYAQFESSWNLGADIGGSQGISATNIPSMSSQVRVYSLWENGIAAHWSLEMGIGFASIISTNQGGYSQYTANIIPIDARLRFAPLESEDWKPYLYGGVGIIHFSLNSTPASNQSGTAFYFPAGIGLRHQLSRQLAIEASGGLNPTLTDVLNPIPDKGKDAYWGFSIGITFTLGAKPKSLSDDEFDLGERGEVHILFGVVFDSATATLKKESDTILTKILNTLDNHTDILVDFRDYTDNSGDFNTNMALTQDRAESVKVWFVSRGIAASRISTVGYGPHNPLVQNTTPENREKNRRLEIVRMK